MAQIRSTLDLGTHSHICEVRQIYVQYIVLEKDPQEQVTLSNLTSPMRYGDMSIGGATFESKPCIHDCQTIGLVRSAALPPLEN